MLLFPAATAERTSSKLMPREANLSGSTWTRTAYFCEPMTFTCATPSTMEMRWAMVVSAYSSTEDNGRVGETRQRKRMGESAGLTLRKDGGLGMSGGRFRDAE